MKPCAAPSDEDRARAARDRPPRAKWLASMSVVLVIVTLPLEDEIDFVFNGLPVIVSLPVIVLTMLIWIGVAALPLLLFVVINGRFGLRHVKIGLSLACFLALVRISLDLWAVVDIVSRGR